MLAWRRRLSGGAIRKRATSLFHGGAPYYRLIAAGRDGPLDIRQLAAARAAYEAHGSNLPRRRAQGGRP